MTGLDRVARMVVESAVRTADEGAKRARRFVSRVRERGG